jgi:hypothetical protein
VHELQLLQNFSSIDILINESFDTNPRRIPTGQIVLQNNRPLRVTKPIRIITNRDE